MEGTMRVLAVILLMGLASGSAWAAEPFICPEKGQSPEQMEKDKSECYTWAKQQTGFDPMQPPQAAPAPPPSGLQHEGQVVQGADGVLILSGTQSARGWNVTINEATGYMVLSVAGDQVAFVVFGACTRP